MRRMPAAIALVSKGGFKISGESFTLDHRFEPLTGGSYRYQLIVPFD